MCHLEKLILNLLKLIALLGHDHLNPHWRFRSYLFALHTVNDCRFGDIVDEIHHLFHLFDGINASQAENILSVSFLRIVGDLGISCKTQKIVKLLEFIQKVINLCLWKGVCVKRLENSRNTGI